VESNFSIDDRPLTQRSRDFAIAESALLSATLSPVQSPKAPGAGVSSPANVLRHVADNLRRARERRGLTQQALAARANVSRRMLTGVETGEANISLATLGRIATALEVPFAELVVPASGQVSQLDVVVWRGKKPGSQARMLLSQPASREIEMWEWSLAPKERYRAEPDPPGSSAFVYVVAGELALSLSGHSVLLKAGSFYAYPCDQPYAYANQGTKTCRFVNNVIT